MAYLEPADYANYGLPAGTTGDWITAATALINSHCRRPDLNLVEYIERMRLTTGAQTVLLSYLPLAPLAPATSVFALPGQWTAIDPALVDFDPVTGELTLPWNVLGLPYNEVQVTYTAGLATIGDDVKSACAQIVRNAQATPALNASMSKIDTMQVKYFSSSLIDETVQKWLKPYVANRLG